MAFGPQTTADEVIAGIDCTGRVVVITGATAGIGLEAARVLASAGARVVLAGRNPDKTAAAIAELREQVPDADLAHGELELGSLDSVRAFASWFIERYDSLDVLINNAGVMAPPLSRTADGFELQFGTNHLGHFLLTGLLAPALIAGAPSRVVVVSSAANYNSDILWDDPHYESRPYRKWEAYGQSKTANVLFAVELDRRLADRGVRANALHPGMILTELSRHLSQEDVQELIERVRSRPSTGGDVPQPKSIAAGAATTVWAATSPDLHGNGGLYLKDCQVSDDHAPYARDPDAAKRLWELSEQLVGQHFDW